MRAKTQPYRGSHLPALIKLFGMTTGPVWEFGCGMYSSPFLHWACWANKRPLVTFESNEGWMEFINQFANEYHQVHLIKDWDNLDLSGPCSLALIDHDVADHKRGTEVLRMTHVDYLVLHDANRPGKYGFNEAYRLYKYRYLCRTPTIPTMVISNIHPLEDFAL